MKTINALYTQMTNAITAGNWVLALSLAMELRRTVLKMSMEAKG